MRIVIFCILLCLMTESHGQINLRSLKLPPGFSISLYADSIENPRELAVGNKGTVFAGSLQAGKVYAIIKDAKSPLGTRVKIIASGLNAPNGVAFYNNALFVAEVDRIIKYDDIEEHVDSPPKPSVIIQLPKEKHHGWRYIRFGPDGKLYVGIGAPCNVCLSEDPKFATILRMNPDGSNLEIYAKGIRNTVGFDWHPLNHKMWFTDNGRDWLGDNLPPDEINRVDSKDQHFGFPYCHGKNILDPKYGKKYAECSQFTPPVFELPAHVAALGMSFYKGKLFPKNFDHQLFIAEHGSWNRSKKIGYQVITANLVNDQILSTQPFITGWLQGNSVWGRPVDIVFLPEGSMLVSDDFANVIYKVSY